MRLKRYWPFLLIFFFSTAALAPACSKKTGCPAESSLQAPKKKKKGKRQEGLMPKKMRKKFGG